MQLDPSYGNLHNKIKVNEKSTKKIGVYAIFNRDHRHILKCF